MFKIENKIKILIFKIFLPVFCFIWFFLPSGMFPVNFFLQEPSSLIYPFNLPFSAKEAFYAPGVQILYFLVYLVPLSAVFFVFSIFYKKIKTPWVYSTALLTLSLMLFFNLNPLIHCANSINWFRELPFPVYFSIISVFILHVFFSLYGIRLLRTRNENFIDYETYCRSQNQEEKTGKRNKIKTKLLVILIGLVFILLFLFAFILLSSYKKMLVETLSDKGAIQAEQTSSVYNSSEGRYDKIAAYFTSQRAGNASAGIPFLRIDVIITDSARQIYLENIDNGTEFPEYGVLAYTTGTPKNIPPEDKKITSLQAADFIKRFENGTYNKEPILDSKNQTCKFVYPVTLSRPQGKKLVGFSVVTYKQEVFMYPYFQIKVCVFTVVIIFIYFSILLTLFISDYIVNPLLFLRVNVRKASDSLSEMMSGSTKISPQNLIYNDVIKTRDEIKDLSLEIGNMVTVIRGITPYISASTLRSAEKDSRKSTGKELCFLFTDIRGFTSLCETLPPKEVVSILNHYLDLETEIILNNGGDVDKFVGDEMMAFFSGAKKEYNACKAAMEIRKVMAEEQKKSIARGLPVISIGIGINTGKVVFGPVGSITRKDFTSIGDTVNLAARLEGANKAYGSKSLVSEAVFEKVNSFFICRELDFITVKGKTKPVKIYEILQIATKSSEKLMEIKNLFEKGLGYYRKKNWDKAESFFRECNAKYQDKPSVVFLERIQHFRQNPPPAKWNGVFKMEVK